jgi:hypothetical protein
MKAAYRAHDIAPLFGLCSLNMKIISLIHRSRPNGTNKEQNGDESKLYLAEDGGEWLTSAGAVWP